MKSSTLRSLLIAGIALPLAFSFTAQAQDSPPSPGAHMQHHMHDPAEMAAHMQAMLQLRPDQDGALKTLLETLKPTQSDHDAMGGRMGADMEDHHHLTAPEHLDRMLAHMDKMRAHLATVADAVKTFYAQLSPAQQKAFDAMVPMLHEHMMMEHHGMDHHGSGHPDMEGDGGEHAPK